MRTNSMKKYLVFFLAVAATFVSCDYSTTTIVGSTQKIVNVTVKAREWQYTEFSDTTYFANNYFYAGVDVPEITENVFDNGEVKAYAVFDNNSTEYARQHLLPFGTPAEVQLENGTWVYYTEVYDFTYGIKWAEFNYRVSDFAYEEDRKFTPPTMNFRIVITTPSK